MIGQIGSFGGGVGPSEPASGRSGWNESYEAGNIGAVEVTTSKPEVN